MTIKEDFEKVTHSRWVDREFIMAVAGHVIGILFLTHVISDPNAAQDIVAQYLDYAKEIIGGLTIIGSNVGFIISRGIAKSGK